MKAKVLLVDDHAIILDGLESLLKQDPDLEIVGKVDSVNFALPYLMRDEVSILISDYSMPDINGLELVKKAKKLSPDIRIIILSMHDEPDVVQEIIRAGVDGYILKKYTHQELLQAIQIIRRGGQYWSPEINRILVRGLTKPADTVQLTEREIEVLKLLTDELTSREIAERLFISERTVESHRKNLLRKTNSSTTVGLIKFAYNNRLL